MDAKLILAFTIALLFIIFFIYDLLKERNKIKKEKNEKEEMSLFYKKISEQLMETSLVNHEILKYLKFSSQKYVEEITESQVRIVVESILSNSQHEIYNYITKILAENHIKGNEKEITSKIKLFIINRFHKDSLLFKEFKYKEKSLGEHSVGEWREYLIENVLNNVLQEKLQKSLSSTLQNAYDSFKYDILDKILS